MLTMAVFLAAQGVRSINDSKNIITAKEEVKTELTGRVLDNTAWDGSKVVRSAKVRMARESLLSAAEVRKKAASLDNELVHEQGGKGKAQATGLRTLLVYEDCSSDKGKAQATGLRGLLE